MTFPHIVQKRWGEERWFANDRDRDYCGKELVCYAGQKSSFHYHCDKDEVFYVIAGELIVRTSHSDEFDPAGERVLRPGERLHIPPRMRHQFEGVGDVRFIEVSTFHRDEDTYRVFPAAHVKQPASSVAR